MKKYLVLLLTLVLIISNGIMVSASTTKEVPVEKITTDSIVIDESNVLAFELIEKVSLTKSTVNKSVSGRFTLVSDGTTVATYGLDSSFSYNGSTVTCTGHNAWSNAKGTDWNCQSTSWGQQISPTYALARAVFDLYHLENGSWVINNDTTIRIYCDEDGDISVYTED